MLRPADMTQSNAPSNRIAQRWIKEAEPLYQRSLAICENVLGAEHPVVARCLCNFANDYCVQGMYEEAALLYERALMIQEQVLGLEHPDLVGLLETYSDLLRNLGRTDKADKHQAQVHAIQAKHEDSSDLWESLT